MTPLPLPLFFTFVYWSFNKWNADPSIKFRRMQSPQPQLISLLSKAERDLYSSIELELTKIVRI